MTPQLLVVAAVYTQRSSLLTCEPSNASAAANGACCFDCLCVPACRMLVGESWSGPHKVAVWDLWTGHPLVIASLPEANWPERDYSKGPTQPHISPDGVWPSAATGQHASYLRQTRLFEAPQNGTMLEHG